MTAETQNVDGFRNSCCLGWEKTQVSVILLFSFLLPDLNVYKAIYLLSDFHDPWALETS